MTRRHPCDISFESSRAVFSVYTTQKTVGCKVRARDQSAFFVASVATFVASQIWGRAQPFVTSLSKYYRNVRETPVRARARLAPAYAPVVISEHSRKPANTANYRLNRSYGW